MSDKKDNEQLKKFAEIFKDKLCKLKKIIDTDLVAEGEEVKIATVQTTEDEDENKGEEKSFDFKVYLQKIKNFKLNEKRHRVLNGVLAGILAVSAAALGYSVYAMQKVDAAYRDVVSQNEELIEKNNNLRDEYNDLRPKYDMLNEEYDKLNNSAEEAKNSEFADFEGESAENTAEEAAQ